MLFPQIPCIELYNASSNDILQLWKMKGKIKKEFEPYSKSYYQILLTGGVSVLSLPSNEKQSLQISNLFLLVQFVLIKRKGFIIELIVRDNFNNKKMIKIVLNNDFPLDIWTNYLIDCANIFQRSYPNVKLKYIDNILITGNIKIRKVYALKTKEEDLPKSLDLGKSVPLQNYFLYDLNKNPDKIDIKFSEHSNKKDNNNNYNTPMKAVKNTQFRTENKVNLNNLNLKTKKNLEYGNKIPNIDRLKNEIIYGLKVNKEGNLENRNMNQILGFKALENIENYNNKERDRSFGKGSLQKEINNNIKRNKNKSLKYKIKNQNINQEKNKYIQNIDNQKNLNQNEKQIIENINNKLVFHNDTLYNFGNNKNKINEPKYLSYGVSSKFENKKINEAHPEKIGKNDINQPIIKDISENKENNQRVNDIANNKYGNIEIMIDSTLVNNSKIQAQLYDSIEEESCLINNINNTLDCSKLDEKIIKLDPQIKRINEPINFIRNDLEISNIPELSNLKINENKESNRPYTPPLSELVPINQSGIIDNKDKTKEKNLYKNNPNNISYTKMVKEPENLIFDENKGCYYNPKTNIYYDIKDII